MALIALTFRTIAFGTAICAIAIGGAAAQAALPLAMVGWTLGGMLAFCIGLIPLD